MLNRQNTASKAIYKIGRIGQNRRKVCNFKVLVGYAVGEISKGLTKGAKFTY